MALQKFLLSTQPAQILSSHQLKFVGLSRSLAWRQCSCQIVELLQNIRLQL